MSEVNLEKLNGVVTTLKETLKDALLATDIWDQATGLSLAGFNEQPVAVALFTKITADIRDSLKDAQFPGLARFYLMDMEADHTVMIIAHGNKGLLQGVLVNAKKANLGLLLSVVLPKMETGVKAALE